MNINTIISEASLRKIDSAREAVQQSLDMLEDAKSALFSDIVRTLKENPGEYITRVDIMNSTGMSADEVDRQMENLGCYGRLVTITRKFAEVDEQGQVVPGGKVRTDRREYKAYIK